MSQRQLPEYVKKVIDEIASKVGADVSSVESEYWSIFDDPQYQIYCSEEEKYKLTLSILRSFYVNYVPLEEVSLVTVGTSGIKQTKSGRVTLDLFGAVIINDKLVLARIRCPDEAATKAYSATIGALYKLKLIKHSDTEYTADPVRTDFSRVEDLAYKDQSLEKILNLLGIEEISVMNASSKPSKVDSSGYIILTDWRVIRNAVIQSRRTYTDKKTGRVSYFYVITDDSVPIEVEVQDGNEVKKELMVWVDESLWRRYEEKSTCDFYGTVKLTPKGANMTAYAIIPKMSKVATDE
jgi:hypothetical protein